MAQLCPVCKTRLWTDPLFTPSKLCCPRCGAEFKPTVPWFYFRLLVVIILALGFVLIAILTEGNLRAVLIVAVLAGLVWFLPRIIDLQHIGPELTPSEGVLDTSDMELKIKDARLEEKYQEAQEKSRFSKALTGLLVVILTGLLLLLIKVLWSFYS